MTAPLVHPPGRSVRRALALVVGALALACGGAQAAPHGGGWHGGGGGWHGGGWHGNPGWHGGGHVVYRGGWGWDPLWPVGVGLGIGLATAPLWVDSPDVVVVNPAPTYYAPATTYYTPAPAPAAPVTSGAPEPIFYPRNNQSAGQLEADRQACNRWATTQRNAMNDASIFQRATLACMDGRGYTAH